MNEDFITFSLGNILSDDSFEVLSKGITFETITKGRQGAVLVEPQNGLVPIIRTTTKYKNPAQLFTPVQVVVKEHITKKGNGIPFNNAMIEIYNSSYTTMGYHTDQALDLENNTWICLLSCYKDPTNVSPRKLKIQDKITKEQSEITLHHNTVVAFSTRTNSRYVHKIVADPGGSDWLGITFRQSKTLIQFVGDVPFFSPTNTALRLAADFNERNVMYMNKSKENTDPDFVWGDTIFSLSESDLLKPN